MEWYIKYLKIPPTPNIIRLILKSLEDGKSIKHALMRIYSVKTRPSHTKEITGLRKPRNGKDRAKKHISVNQMVRETWERMKYRHIWRTLKRLNVDELIQSGRYRNDFGICKKIRSLDWDLRFGPAPWSVYKRQKQYQRYPVQKQGLRQMRSAI